MLVSIGGATAFDTFTFGAGATLGGVLEISLLDGYEPNGATLIYNGVGPVTVPEAGSAVFGLLGLLPLGAFYLRRKLA